MRLKVQIQLSRGEAGVSGSELAISAANAIWLGVLRKLTVEVTQFVWTVNTTAPE